MKILFLSTSDLFGGAFIAAYRLLKGLQQKRLIEKKFSVKWYEAIQLSLDKNQASGVSDYESYGQFMF